MLNTDKYKNEMSVNSKNIKDAVVSEAEFHLRLIYHVKINKDPSQYINLVFYLNVYQKI